MTLEKWPDREEEIGVGVSSVFCGWKVRGQRAGAQQNQRHQTQQAKCTGMLRWPAKIKDSTGITWQELIY